MPVLSREPEVGDRLPVKEGASGQIVEQFANSRGNVQGFPGFVSMEVLSSEVGDEVLVITRWQDKARQGKTRTPSTRGFTVTRSRELMVGAGEETCCGDILR